MTPRFLEKKTVRAVQRTALANGGKVRQFSNSSNGNYSTRTVEWDVSGNCTKPVFVELAGRKRMYREKTQVITPDTGTQPDWVVMEVRCRKCENCLAVRASQWRLRSRNETSQSVRTWLCTLTLAPTARTEMLYRAVLRLSRSGVKIETLSVQEQFLEVEKECFREVQLWLKRLRKNTSAEIRYLAITEAHKSGDPHYHVLLHEQGKPLRYDGDLKGSWQKGFATYKLVRDAAGASYVTKYLSKDIAARVRASGHYGGADAPPVPPLSE